MEETTMAGHETLRPVTTIYLHVYPAPRTTCPVPNDPRTPNLGGTVPATPLLAFLEIP